MNTRLLEGVSVLMILLSLVGCTSQLHPGQRTQAEAQKQQAEEPTKGAMPTFTYRPGE